MSDTQDPRETALMAATDKLGKAIQASPEKEREIIRKLYDDVKEFAVQQEAKGVLVDKGAFFAAGIIFHPEIDTDDVIAAAVEYVDKDWLFTKGHQEPAKQG